MLITESSSKIKGLNEESDYNNVKSSHSKWISNETDANVLYYKLYKNRNTDEWLGSGDFTIDTKEAFDKLLSREDDGKHEYTQEGILVGISVTIVRVETDLEI